MKRKLEEIIVLYDTHDKGKTSTLRELINVMAGSVPTKGGDIRVNVSSMSMWPRLKHQIGINWLPN